MVAVEEIVSHRRINKTGICEVYVKWQDDNELTWEPLNIMYEDINDMIVKYFEDQNL
jgi:hypothetical protein